MRCEISLTAGANPPPLKLTACRDGYIDTNRKCVTNCGPGMYGKASFSSRGIVSESKCFACDSSCAECVGAGPNQCKECKNGFYLQRSGTSFSTVTMHGTCVAKISAPGGLFE